MTRVAEIPIQPGIKNPYGVAHVGAILWFADLCATMLVLGPNKANRGMKGFPLAISLNAILLGNQSEGKRKAIASFVKQGKTMSIVRTSVYGEGICRPQT